eukprot:TRINITY_DN77481_c0_g1_i1.p1 TRINITY_DN77481_c0_g1~~TRINITY_DN77481_c0_g1_i1.p1  ORF type:complete len:493 (+),score=104.11 TRINITY_DN77481_c0_g1_i1:46-1524(+)
MPNSTGSEAIDSEGISAALRHAAERGYFPCVQDADSLEDPKGASLGSLLRKPVAVMYDLGVWDSQLQRLTTNFGSGYMHALAVKGTGIGSLLKRAVSQGFGLECASIGEVLHAQAIGCPADRIVFDSPIKTRPELSYAMRQGMHLNLDNLEELARLAQIRKAIENDLPPKGSVTGLRINPLCGAGEIAALSVSVADSKFGVPVSKDEQILSAFKEHPWLNCIHVHVGSGGMGMKTLVEGVKVAAEFSQRINQYVGRRQVTVLDIGGGLHPDYSSDDLPPFSEYAEELRREVPGLFAVNGKAALFDQVVTEFGQSLSAKAGFVASRLEYVKKIQDGNSQIAVSHFGADLCPRQCYTNQHKRRIEFFDGASCSPLKRSRTTKHGKDEEELKTTHLAGPLCFQGDFTARDLQAPALSSGDFAVLREGGSNTLALFSRHCSRMAPSVLGYKLCRQGEVTKVSSLEVLKQSESLQQLCSFWGSTVPEALEVDVAALT